MEVGTDVEISARKAAYEQRLDLDQIRPSELNPRKVFDQDGLKELAESIRQHGLLEPIVVRTVRVPAGAWC